MSNPRGRPKKREPVVSPEQKITLRQLVQQPRSSRSLAFRARIVLECASGESNAAVAAKLRTTGFTVGMWRNRFITEGIVGLGDEMRAGARRQIGQDGTEPIHGEPHLAGLRVASSSQRNVSVIQ